MVQDREMAREIFRDRALKAMDDAAREIFGASVNRNDCGATDADLPELFAALDAQLERLAVRFRHPLYDDLSEPVA